MNIKTLFLGVVNYSRTFIIAGVLRTNPRVKRGMTIHIFVMVVPLPIVLAPCLHSHLVHIPMLFGMRWPHGASPTGFVVALTLVHCGFILHVKIRQNIS